MPHVSEVAETGGAVVAVSSAIFGYTNSAMGWMNHNSAGILAICGIVGVVISYLGHIEKKKHLAKILEHEIRQKQRRKNE